MFEFELHPLLILAIGIATVLGTILVLKLNAFVALITAAMLVSLLAPGPLPAKFSRVAEAFGGAAGRIGIVIALAAVIGKCMMDSGAADRIVRAFLRLLGEKRAPTALMGSGFVLAIPVFFDTVFYLLVPLARSLFRRTGRNYIQYLVAIAAGGAVTHSLVPPTPGPLAMADNLSVDLGTMIMVGLLVGLPPAFAGLAFARLANRLYDIPMRPLGAEPEPTPIPDEELPSLFLSILPVALPVVLISANTVLRTLAGDPAAGAEASLLHQAADIAALVGDANFALLLSAAIALLVLYHQRRIPRYELSRVVETALLSGGLIILITAAGGAFGEMLREAQIGDAIRDQFTSGDGRVAGTMTLVLGFGIAALMKIAQGSGTVAMITASSMMAAMIDSPQTLGFHPVYLATAVGSGSVVGSWMNDSGFWIFAKMGGLTEVETLKTWTILLIVLGLTGLAVTLVLAWVLPLA